MLRVTLPEEKSLGMFIILFCSKSVVIYNLHCDCLRETEEKIKSYESNISDVNEEVRECSRVPYLTIQGVFHIQTFSVHFVSASVIGKKKAKVR